MEIYEGEIAPCGIYCGGCPKFDLGCGCKGAEIGCRKCKGIYVCCVELRHLKFCYECRAFPCYKFKAFSSRWEKYGQNLVENQLYIREQGVKKFRDHILNESRKGTIGSAKNT